jgi:ubiquinone/menaquinone biosynthesis C-methylase UbiE
MSDKRDVWIDLEKAVQDQLKLQVAMQFEHHHGFMLKNGLDGCRNVIDLGTGNGAFLAKLARKHPHTSFTGIDSHEGMLNHARKIHLDNVRWCMGDVNDFESIPGLKNADGVLMRYLLLHLKDTSTVISNVYEGLPNDARLWIIDLDIEHFHCDPPHEAFDLIKRLLRQFFDEHGKDSNVGSRLRGMLEGVGFHTIDQETEELNTESVDIGLLQRFMKQEVIAYRHMLPDFLTGEELAMIEKFIEDLSLEDTFVNYGVTMVSAIK